MLSYLISHNSDRFDCRGEMRHLFDILTTGGVLFWDRDGLRGKIPSAVLGDLLRTFVAYKEMQQRGRIVDLPAAAYELTWEQTIEHRPASGEKLRQPLRLDVVPTEGQSGDDTGVPH